MDNFWGLALSPHSIRYFIQDIMTSSHSPKCKLGLISHSRSPMGLNVCVHASLSHFIHVMRWSSSMYTIYVLILNVNINASLTCGWRVCGWKCWTKMAAEVAWWWVKQTKLKQNETSQSSNRCWWVMDGLLWSFKVLFLFVLPRCWRLEPPLPPPLTHPPLQPTLWYIMDGSITCSSLGGKNRVWRPLHQMKLTFLLMAEPSQVRVSSFTNSSQWLAPLRTSKSNKWRLIRSHCKSCPVRLMDSLVKVWSEPGLPGLMTALFPPTSHFF